MSVAIDGPFGKAGSVMWVCPAHKRLIQDWNDEEVTKKNAVKKAADIMQQIKWPHSV